MADTQRSAYERVQLARSKDRPNIQDYIDHLFTDFFEQRGDRASMDDGSIVGGIAMLGDRPVTARARPWRRMSAATSACLSLRATARPCG